MKLDKIKFAQVVAFIVDAMRTGFDDEAIRRLDELIDVELPEAEKAMPPAKAAELLKALANSRKIEAIKLVREVYGYGIKEAKDFVEQNYSYILPTSDRNRGASLSEILGK